MKQIQYKNYWGKRKMTLKEKQFLFGQLMPKLFMYMSLKGFNPVLGYGFRDQKTQNRMVETGASKTKNSNHLRCIAVDIELHDKEGHYLTSTEDHRQFGKWWEALHPMCRWGGPFGDGNHYSLFHDGVI